MSLSFESECFVCCAHRDEHAFYILNIETGSAKKKKKKNNQLEDLFPNLSSTNERVRE